MGAVFNVFWLLFLQSFLCVFFRFDMSWGCGHFLAGGGWLWPLWRAYARTTLQSGPRSSVFVRRRLSAHVKDYRRLVFPDVLQRGPHYNLMAVVVHEGDRPYSGHYYAYCRVGADWFKYNDSIVQQVAPREVLFVEATLLVSES